MKLYFAARVKLAISRYLKDETGATAVEFAIVGPVFLLLFLSIFETGLMLFTEYSMQVAVQDASRKILTGQAQNAGWSVNKFTDEVCRQATVIRNCKNRLDVYVVSTDGAQTFADLKASIPADVSGPPNPDETARKRVYNHGKASCKTAVYAFLDWKFSVPLMFALSNKNNNVRRLKAYTIFRTETYTATSNKCT